MATLYPGYNLSINALGHPPDLDEIANRLDDMTSEIMSSDSVRLTVEYLRKVRKPRTLKVQAFQARIMAINAFIPYMTNGEENQKLTDNEIKQIIENGVPISWRRQQRAAHLVNFTLQETISYYTELQALENETNRNNQRGSAQTTPSNNNGARNRNSYNNRYSNRTITPGRGGSSSSGRGQPGNRNRPSNNNNNNNYNSNNNNNHPARGPSNSGPWCYLHNTNTHDIAECRAVQNRMQTRSMTNQQTLGRVPTPSTRPKRYHQLQPKPTNHQSSSRPSRRENSYAINEHPASDDESSSSEKMFAVRGGGAIQQKDHPKSNHAVVLVKIVSPNHPIRLCRALLDSGATSSLVNASLTHPEELIKENHPTNWVTKGGSFRTTHIAKVNFHFLELNSKQQINGIFHVDNDASQHSGGYDLIIGFDLMETIGLDLLISERLIKWGDYSTSMNITTKKNNYTINTNTTNIFTKSKKPTPPKP
ncbi:MAG: hypothetical protein ACREOZ_02765, partial [Gloeomargaritales cyanobacterium]